MYSFNERIRYSELGENGELSLVGLLNLFQDCSTFQSEDLGLGIKYLHMALMEYNWGLAMGGGGGITGA